MIELIREFFFAMMCVIGFAIMFNIPRRLLIQAGIIGALGWCAYIYFMDNIANSSFSAFVGASVVGILGELLAYKLKKPATLFIIPGIIPLVPGFGLYYSMLKIIEKNYDEAVNVGFESLLIAVSIAGGIIVSTAFGKAVRNSMKVKMQQV